MKIRHSAVIICSTLFSLLYPFASRADVIILKDASTMTVYNVERAGKWILYTLENSEDAPLQRIEVKNVFAIKTDTGELQSIGDEPEAKTEVKAKDREPVREEAVAADDNASRIDLYNSAPLSLKKPKGEKDREKICSDFITLWGITSNSILSDKNILIELVMLVPETRARLIIPQYKVRITNKTDKALYIDLANSFKFNADGTAEPYFTNSVYTEGGSSGKGVSLNMGAVAGAMGIGGALGTLAQGVGVGSGSSKSASVTTAEERILMIPPHSAVTMPPMKYADGSSFREDFEVLYIRTIPLKGILTSDGDMRRYDATKGFVHQLEQKGGIDSDDLTSEVIQAPLGHIREFSEDDSPKKLRRIITYSTEADFSTYSSVEYTMYVRGVMGSSIRWNVPYDYDLNYLKVEDPEHLLLGVGKVKKK